MSIRRLFLFVLLFGLCTSVRAEESVVLTVAEGGNAIAASSYNGEFTSLSPIIIKETAASQIGPSETDLTIKLPEDFNFDIESRINITASSSRIDNSLLTCAGGGNRTIKLGTSQSGSNSVNVTPADNLFTVHIKQSSAGNCKGTVTISGMKVRPASAASQSGHIKYQGTTIISGITADETSLGELIIIDDIEEDEIAPVITLIGDSEIEVEVHTDFEDPGAEVSDNSDEEIEVNIEGEVDTTILGDYTIYYTASDLSGNEAEPMERIVHVIDTTPPEIILNGVTYVEVVEGNVFEDPGASANDNYDGEVEVLITGDVDTSILGQYEILYEASDSSSNHSSKIRSINVIELEAGLEIKESTQASGNRSGARSSRRGAGLMPVTMVTSFSVPPLKPTVLGASTVRSCESKKIDIGNMTLNAPEEISKLQDFLNKDLVLAIPITGFFGDLTLQALSLFEMKYGNEITEEANILEFVNRLICR